MSIGRSQDEYSPFLNHVQMPKKSRADNSSRDVGLVVLSPRPTSLVIAPEQACCGGEFAVSGWQRSSSSFFCKLFLFFIFEVISVTSAWGAACYGLFSETLRIESKLEQIPTDLVPFEDASMHLLAPDWAKKGIYIRRPTENEMNQAISSGQFPDDPRVRSAIFVMQEQRLDYKQPGQIVLARGHHKSRKWNEILDFEATEHRMKTQLESGQVVGEITLAKYRDTLSNKGDAALKLAAFPPIKSCSLLLATVRVVFSKQRVLTKLLQK